MTSAARFWKEAKRLEEEGNKVLKLNIGNLGAIRLRGP